MRTIVTFVLCLLISASAYCQTLDNTANPNTSSLTGNANGYDWVDLGLSVKWATCNVGANSASDNGVYFYWGETNNITTINDSIIASNNEVLSHTEHDVATEERGNGWFTPTKWHYDELIANTTQKWSKQNGVNGLLFTSKINGQSIFLPAGGYGRKDKGKIKKEEVGKLGKYTALSVEPWQANGLRGYFEQALVFSNSANPNITNYGSGINLTRPVYSENIEQWGEIMNVVNDFLNTRTLLSNDEESLSSFLDSFSLNDQFFLQAAYNLYQTTTSEKRLPSDKETLLLRRLLANGNDLDEALQHGNISLTDSITILEYFANLPAQISIPGFVYMGQKNKYGQMIFWAVDNYIKDGNDMFNKYSIPSSYPVTMAIGNSSYELTASLPTTEDYVALVKNTTVSYESTTKRQRYSFVFNEKGVNDLANHYGRHTLVEEINTNGVEVKSKENGNKIYMPSGRYWVNTHKNIVEILFNTNKMAYKSPVEFSGYDILDNFTGTPYARFVVYVSNSYERDWQRKIAQYQEELQRLMQLEESIKQSTVNENEQDSAPRIFENVWAVEEYVDGKTFKSKGKTVRFAKSPQNRFIYVYINSDPKGYIERVDLNQFDKSQATVYIHPNDYSIQPFKLSVSRNSQSVIYDGRYYELVK